ncbi:MAG: T9SS type A sorting domain-containing protein, partial [Saprospiraceae bacterium]
YQGKVETNYSNLWVFDHHFALYSSYNLDTLFIFNRMGLRVEAYPIELKYSEHIVFNNCNELLFIDQDKYYLFREQGLELLTGTDQEIIPDTFDNTSIQGQDGFYYIKNGSHIYSTPCGIFDWQSVYQDALLDSMSSYWLTRQSDVLLYTYFGNAFYDQSGWTTDRQLYTPSIHFPCLLRGTDESTFDRQVTRTSNNIYTKLVNESEWALIYSQNGKDISTNYAPNGDLYMARPNDILYSKDNGAHMSIINLPFGQSYPYLTYRLKVLDNNLLFLHRAFNSNYLSYYSTNKGVDWKAVSIATITNDYFPFINLIGNQIQIAYLQQAFFVERIHLGTGEVTSHPIGQYFNTWSGAVADDGTIYYMASENGFNRGLYRYRFGDSPVWLGDFPENPYTLLAAGNNVYAVSDSLIHLLNDGQIKEYICSGLPVADFPHFLVSENDHLYVIYDQRRVFRSKEALSFNRFISGSVLHNKQGDCVTDPLDPGLGSWAVTIENDQFRRTTPTTLEGDFASDVPIGEYTVSLKPINAYWQVCDSVHHIMIDTQSSVVSQDFLAIALDDCSKLEIDFSTPLLRRCFQNIYYVTVRNTGPEPNKDALVRITLDPLLDFISSSIPHTQISSHVFEFDLGVIAVNDAYTFQVKVRLSCNAELGAEHCVEGTVVDNRLCDFERTSYTECQHNVGSYDPNDKRVFNEAGFESGQVDKGEYIYYNIRFQNTGTDTAFSVHINDQLSPMLDYRTLEMLSASHPFSWLLTDGPELSILFDNILLPDSNVNEPASHGFVKFRIKPFPEINYGTNIQNTASIYFDFNDPVLTNTVATDILPLVKTTELRDRIEFDISPNPANSVIHLTLSEEASKQIDACVVVDVLGRPVIKVNGHPDKAILVSHLAPGVYSLILQSNGEWIGIKKFIKL